MNIGDVNELKKEIDDLHADNQLLQTSIEQLYIEKQKQNKQKSILFN